MDRPFKPKYGTVSQVLLQLVVALFNIFAEETKSTYGSVCDIIIIINIRELKQRRRRRQRERQKGNWFRLTKQQLCTSITLSFFVHFFAVVALIQREST